VKKVFGGFFQGLMQGVWNGGATHKSKFTFVPICITILTHMWWSATFYSSICRGYPWMITMNFVKFVKLRLKIGIDIGCPTTFLLHRDCNGKWGDPNF